MSVPTATYRIQFRNGMTFDRAAEQVPYLKRLGISHLYASPIFTATSGSSHGYDVTDATEIDPAIGGRIGFDRMVRSLKGAGLGLILDIVPNHMAASLENAWWRDVVEHGAASRYARHFDIDWSRKLTLPFLGGSFDEALHAGEITIERDPKTGNPAFAFYEAFYPLAPETYSGRKDEILSLSDKTEIKRLHDLQPYRLMSWRDAPRDLSYRRFFEITGLAGVRVEDATVFADTHRLILDLVRSGAVDGLRIDHVDGLADPKSYLERLREQTGPACYITVEKILGEGEMLSPDWPVSGTTGYEFIAALSDVFVDNDKMEVLRGAYQKLVGPLDMKEELRSAKTLMVDNNFAGEFAVLIQLARRIGETDDSLALPEETLAEALRELLICFPVYRTYGTGAGLPGEDRRRLASVMATVQNATNGPDARALATLERILLGDVDHTVGELASTFRTRFQQLTGPLMAKSVEDTLFFRQGALLALNEVGADPLPRTYRLDRFHEEMKSRLLRQPDALSASSTHDTKRGEDARARLYALTEAPEAWSRGVDRWREMNRTLVQKLDDGLAPEPSVEWMLYQALAGVWPADLEHEDAASLGAIEDRFVAYTEKALREAKLRTTWNEIDEAYESAVIAYVRRLLSPDNRAFLDDFTKTLRPFVRSGLVNSITQAIIKLTAPGVPDIYQGSEGLDFSLVDPDNRREPDFETLQRHLLGAGDEVWAEDNGRLKQHVITTLLHVRQQVPTLFRRGDYLPLIASGPRATHVLAYARADQTDVVVVVTPRLWLGVDDLSAPIPWAGTRIALPAAFQDRSFIDLLTGRLVHVHDELQLEAFTKPFVVLKST